MRGSLVLVSQALSPSLPRALMSLQPCPRAASLFLRLPGLSLESWEPFSAAQHLWLRLTESSSARRRSSISSGHRVPIHLSRLGLLNRRRNARATGTLLAVTRFSRAWRTLRSFRWVL